MIHDILRKLAATQYPAGDLSVFFKTLQTHQPSWESIKSLSKNSEFHRTVSFNPRFDVIEHEKEIFRFQELSKTDSEDIAAAHQILLETFTPDEVDPLEMFKKDIVRGRTNIYTLKGDKDIKGIFIGSLEDFNDTDSILMVSYIVTAAHAQKHGIAREMYISALTNACIKAEQRGKRLVAACGECVSSSEEYWNKVNWKRLYIQTNMQEYQEVEYYQPALHFDPGTGEVVSGSTHVAEHFMLTNFVEYALSKEFLHSLVRLFYDTQIMWPSFYFENHNAYETHKRYISGLLDAFWKSLEVPGEITLLSKAERLEKTKNGTVFKEHDAEHIRKNDHLPHF